MDALDARVKTQNSKLNAAFDLHGLKTYDLASRPSKVFVDLNNSCRPSPATSFTRASSAFFSAASIGLKALANATSCFNCSMLLMPITCAETGRVRQNR